MKYLITLALMVWSMDATAQNVPRDWLRVTELAPGMRRIRRV